MLLLLFNFTSYNIIFRYRKISTTDYSFILITHRILLWKKEIHCKFLLPYFCQLFSYSFVWSKKVIIVIFLCFFFLHFTRFSVDFRSILCTAWVVAVCVLYSYFHIIFLFFSVFSFTVSVFSFSLSVFFSFSIHWATSYAEIQITDYVSLSAFRIRNDCTVLRVKS